MSGDWFHQHFGIGKEGLRVSAWHGPNNQRSRKAGRPGEQLNDAGAIDIAPYDTGFKTGVKLTLGHFKPKGQPLDLTLYLTVALEGADVFERFAIDNFHRAVSAQFTLRQPDLAIAASTDFLEQFVVGNVGVERWNDGVLEWWSAGLLQE